MEREKSKRISEKACGRDMNRKARSCRFVGKIREKAVTTHSSTLAWRIPWVEEPGRPQSMGSLRVGHD